MPVISDSVQMALASERVSVLSISIEVVSIIGLERVEIRDLHHEAGGGIQAVPVLQSGVRVAHESAFL